VNQPARVWHLVIEELRYLKIRIAVGYVVIFALFLTRWLLQRGGIGNNPAEIPEHLANMTRLSYFVICIIVFSMFSGLNREKRDRLLSVLPIDPLHVILARLFTVLLINLGVFTGFLATVIVILNIDSLHYGGGYLMASMPATLIDGNIWTVISIFLIGLYLSMLVVVGKSWRMPAWLGVIYLVAAVVVTSFLIYPLGTTPDVLLPGWSIYTSFHGVLYLGLFVILTAFLAIQTHLRRQSFNR
jgi:hypothetical protein